MLCRGWHGDSGHVPPKEHPFEIKARPICMRAKLPPLARACYMPLLFPSESTTASKPPRRLKPT
eukprot:352987-Chlamydomonas_euryale.AAC.8